MQNRILYFFNHMLWRAVFVSLESLETSMTGWIRYVQVRRWQLLDAASSIHSPALLLSAMGITRTTQNSLLALVLWLIKNHSHICVCAAFTSRSYYSWVVFIWYKSFRLCGYYRRNTVIGKILSTIASSLLKAPHWVYILQTNKEYLQVPTRVIRPVL